MDDRRDGWMDRWVFPFRLQPRGSDLTFSFDPFKELISVSPVLSSPPFPPHISALRGPFQSGDLVPQWYFPKYGVSKGCIETPALSKVWLNAENAEASFHFR